MNKTLRSASCLRTVLTVEAVSKDPVNAARVRQAGFTLIELMVVMVILAILAMLAVPKFQSYLLEAKAPTIAKDLQGAVGKMVASHSGNAAGKYAAVNIAELGAQLRNTNFTITGTPATAITHPLGAGSAAANVTIAPVNAGGTAGADSGFTILFSNVDQAACTGLANGLSGMAEAVQINGGASVNTDGSTGNAKAFGGAYSASVATTACDSPASALAFVFR